LRTDETPVQNFVVINHQGTYQTVENTPYPKAGAPNPIVKLGVAEVKSGAVQFVDTANYKPEDFLISRVAWSPDSKRVVFQAQNREQTYLDLNAADRTSGKTVTLLRKLLRRGSKS
jgi:dipeptidyl-peptidase-4